MFVKNLWLTSFKFEFVLLTIFSLLVTTFFIWQGNPIYSILSLIVGSLGLGYTLYLSGSEFISVLVVLVYVGAVTVLFLFVVMMINFRISSDAVESFETFIFWGVTGFYLLNFDLCSGYDYSFFNGFDLSNFGSFGQFIYNSDYNLMIVFTGLILLIGMISSICLTYVSSENYRSQHVWVQVNTSNSVFVYR